MDDVRFEQQPDRDVAIVRSGDDAAFGALVERYRHELQVHCYRMLGSLTDAEDHVQETLLRAWRSRSSFAGRSTIRAWLYRIATNACLDTLRTHPERVIPIGDAASPPPSEIPWLQPYPDLLLDRAAPSGDEPDALVVARETIELAYLAAIQLLPPNQRAVLILRDVLGYSAREVAQTLETTPTGVDSALQRAHKAVDERLPERSQQAMLGSLDDPGQRKIVDRFVDAWERADVAAVVAMLAADGAMTMPPVPTWYRGREAVTVFLESVVFTSEDRWRLVPARANGQLAFGKYLRDDERETFAPHSISVLTLGPEGIAEITTFLDPELLPSFGLPDEIKR
jgi:RNA polymerase sigma-70 factor, ECF subfamily